MRYLTAEIPPIRGRFKADLEDFCVTEIPAYPASGEGTHLFLKVEKRGISSITAAQRLAKALQVRENEIGYAGLKDVAGITVQYFSVEHVAPERISELSIKDLKILAATRHGNKLKRGHLAGNRFQIRIRDISPAGQDAAGQVMTILRERGLANYFGEQRFGQGGLNPELGRRLLSRDLQGFLEVMLGEPRSEDPPPLARARELYREGDHAAALELMPRSQERLLLAGLVAGKELDQIVYSLPKRLLQLLLSSLQSLAFNQVLARRLEANLFDRICTGDQAYLHRNGATFFVEDGEVESPRCTAFEISPTGPLPGPKCHPATGIPGELESLVLQALDLAALPTKIPHGLSLKGTRRPLRVPLEEIMWEAPGADTLELTFALPPGSYATVVLNEIFKGEPGPLAEQ